MWTENGLTSRLGLDAKPSQGVRDNFWLQGMQSSVVASYECVKAFSETDFTEDLKKFEVPTLIIHGDADQIVPISDSAELSSKIVKNATLKVIPGAPHACAPHTPIRSTPCCSTFSGHSHALRVTLGLRVICRTGSCAAKTYGDPCKHLVKRLPARFQ